MSDKNLWNRYNEIKKSECPDSGGLPGDLAESILEARVIREKQESCPHPDSEIVYDRDSDCYYCKSCRKYMAP